MFKRLNTTSSITYRHLQQPSRFSVGRGRQSERRQQAARTTEQTRTEPAFGSWTWLSKTVHWPRETRQRAMWRWWELWSTSIEAEVPVIVEVSRNVMLLIRRNVCCWATGQPRLTVTQRIHGAIATDAATSPAIIMSFFVAISHVTIQHLPEQYSWLLSKIIQDT